MIVAGKTVLHLASMCQLPVRKKLVTALVKAGAPLAAKDSNGDKPVDLGYRISETTLFD